MSSGTQPRSLKERWANGESTLGAWCMMPGALGVESVGSLGFDWVLIDMQHGCMACAAGLQGLCSRSAGPVQQICIAERPSQVLGSAKLQCLCSRSCSRCSMAPSAWITPSAGCPPSLRAACSRASARARLFPIDEE